MASRLCIEFCGEEHTLAPGDSLSFGREGDLVVDENPYLHRVLGVFRHAEGHWWLDNTGRSISVRVHDCDGPTAAVVAPGHSVALRIAEFVCTFVAGPTRYALDGSLTDPALRPAEGRHPDDDGTGRRTLEWGVVELNDDQRLLLVGLAEGRLRNEPEWTPPPKAASARRLGWSTAKYNRKLDHLCEKLDRAGVEGLCGVEGLQAADRRRRLVDHALAHRLVCADDLVLLDDVSDPLR
jgi:hypothetical protein